MFLKSQKLQSEVPEKLEANNGFTLALLEMMGQGVSFEAPYTIQKLKPTSRNKNVSRIETFLVFLNFLKCTP